LWPIFGVSIIGWYIGLKKLVYLRKVKRARVVFSRTIMELKGGHSRVQFETGVAPYDSLLREIQSSAGVDSRQSEFLFREFLTDILPDIEQGFSTMAACVSVAPLLGLLGTISGMNRMFSVITDVGLGSPGLMAGGISVALECALAGLAVAVGIMFFHNYLYNKKNNCIHELRKDGEKLVSGFGAV
jgi:biopolymer transport protein ExbB